MKKIILLSLIGFASFTYAQKITVTPVGIKDANDIEKTYVVITVEGKTAKQLYDDAIKYINKNYKNPEEVIKGKTDGEYLNFITYESSFIEIKNGWAKTPFNAEYRTELNFKDGKVKYEIIELEMTNEANFSLEFTGSGISFFIYNKKGELKKEDAKKYIEDYFNSKIASLSDFLQGKSEDNKW